MQGSSSLTADVVIIGTGSAGMSAYKAARRFTDSILVIEEGAYGTTCARVGCMPSKLLIAAAEAAHHSANAARFGIETGPITVDGKAVMDRVRSERDRFVGFVEEDVESWPDAHKVIGSARFVGPNDLELDDGTRICGDRIIIATGSRPVWPAHWNDLGDRLIINDDVFSWTDLPRAVAVFGNGVIGLELAQALHRLGVRIKLYGLGGLVGPLTDPEIVNAARSAFASEFRFAPEADVISIKREASSVIVTERIDGGVIKERFDYLLAATGRRPNLDRLNLEKAGILLDARGTPMDWDRHSLTQHLAMELAEHNIRVNAVSPAVVVTPIYGAFIDPDAIATTLSDGFDAFHPIGRVGQVEDIANHVAFLLSDKAGCLRQP